MMETELSSGKLHLTKLDGSNYPAWKFKVKMLLTHKRLWNSVSGEDNDAEKSAKAMSLIGLSVQDSQIVYIQDCATGKDAWDKLSSLYENTGVANKMHLMEELMTSKMDVGTMAHKHIEKLRSIVGKLGTIGAAVSDDHYKMALLRSLPDSYDGLVVTLENIMDTLSIEDIHDRIIREEARKGKSDGSSGNNLSEKLLHSKDIRCHFCKKKGHIKSQCWKLKGKRNYSEGHSNGKGYHGKPKGGGTHAFRAGDNNKPGTYWYIDSGLSYHATSDASLFINNSMRKISVRRIELADGSMVEADTTGTISGVFITDYGEYSVTLLDVLLVPKMKVNLISVSAIQDKSYYVTFRNNVCEIVRETDGDKALIASKQGRSYKVEFRSTSIAYVGNEVKPAPRNIWHARLGHPSSKFVDELVKGNLLSVPKDDITASTVDDCTACAEGKMTRRHFGDTKSSSSTNKLQLVHSDLCGPMRLNSLGGARYFLILVDDYTRFTYVTFLKKKSDTLCEFKRFVTMIDTQGNGQIRALRTDNGTEYVNKAFNNYLTSKGIVHQTSAPYTPEQNGIAERANRTLIEKSRCMLRHSKLSVAYWAEAVATACHIKNISPTRSIGNKIPKKEFMGESISYNHLRIFGCLSYVHTPKEKRKKFDAVSKPCVFVGYTATSKQYRFYDPISKRLIVSASAKFMEGKICTVQNNCVMGISHSDNIGEDLFDPLGETDTRNENEGNHLPAAEELAPEIEEVQAAIPAEVPVQPLPQLTLRRSTRHSTPPNRLTYEHADTDDDEDVAAMFSGELDKGEISYVDATTGNDSEKWLSSMQKEYDSLVVNDTWKLVLLPEGKKAIPCRWVYKIKPATRAEKEIYKSRLVAKGFRQVCGVDYDDTYAPVVRLSALRILLSVSVNLGMHVHTMDVKNAFLNSELDYDVYMEQPDGLLMRTTQTTYVC